MSTALAGIADVSAVRAGPHAGSDGWIVETPLARAAISAWGGQLLSWQPAGAAQDVLWLSPRAKSPRTPSRPAGMRGRSPPSSSNSART